MNLIKRGENQLLEAHTLNGGQLRIGASDTICRYYLVPYLNQFHKEFPNIHIKVTNQTSIECARFLENGQADFIVTNYPNSALAGNMNTRVINEFHDVFVASRAAFPLEGRKLGLEELLDYPIMMLDRKSTTSEFLHQIFQKRQLDLVPEIELSSNDLLIDLARIGLGIASVSYTHLHPLRHITRMIYLFYISGGKTNLVAIGGISLGSAVYDFPLGQFAL